MYTLGINAAFHDSAACLVKDGQLVAAAEDERFTHIKHGKRPIPFAAYKLPYHAINYCLQSAGITLHQVDHFAYSFDPYLLMPAGTGEEAEINLPLFPAGKEMPEKWLSPWDPIFLQAIANAPGQLTDGYPHHLQTTRISQVDMLHLLGVLYEKITTHLGFLHSSDEYKVIARKRTDPFLSVYWHIYGMIRYRSFFM